MVDKNEMDAIIDQVYKDLKEHGYVTKETTDELKRLEQAQADYNKKLALGGQAVSKLADAGMAAASAMYKGEKGAAAFNSSVDSMAEAAMAAGAALTLMIPGGPVIKAFVAGMTLAVGGIAKMYKASAEMADGLYTSFQKISKSGAAGSDGLTGLYKDVQKLGLGVQDLDGYITLINANSRDLALFAGSVFEGRKRFADLGKAMEPFREQLYNAGLTQEEVNAGAMSYLKLQTRIGQSQTQTTQQLAEGARKYLIEQDALTKLTGQSRQEAEQTIEAARSEQRFRAKLEQMRNSGDEKQIAAAAELEKANQLISSQSKEAAQAFRDMSTGMITTEAAQKGLISSNGVLMEQATKIAAGQQTAIDGTRQVGQAFGEFAKDTNMLAQAGVFEDIGIKFSEAVELGLLANRDLAAEYKKIQEDQAKQGITGKKAADDLQQAQTDLRLEQLKAMQSAQDFVSKGMLPATYAAIKMTTATDSTVSALNKLVDTILKLVDDITNSSIVKYLTGADDRAKTQEEISADQKYEAAKAQHEKAYAGVGMFDPVRFGIGSTKEQDAAEKELLLAKHAAERTRAQMNEKYGTTKQSAAAAGMPGTIAPLGSAPAAAPQPMTAQGLEQSGVKIRGTGDVQAPGAEVSPTLIELAKKIQNSVPGFQYFSGFNDKFHNREAQSSLHTKGMAADFVLAQKPSKEEGEQIVKLLKSMGASKVRDEYNYPSAKATAGHFHVEIPKFGDGGISPGPQLAMVGEKGPEAHVPLKGGAIPVTISFKDVLNSMDLKFGNAIAKKLGDYGKQTDIITDPQAWKDIIKSGMLMNYDVGAANIGSRIIGDDVGNVLGDRVKEVMENNRVDVNAALAQTAKEFRDVMMKIVTEMQQQKDPEMQAQMMEHLAAISRSTGSTATASERMATYAAN